MDLIDEAPGNAPEFTVSEISGSVKRVLEGEFAHIRVRGEVGRVFRARSGHLYFDLKDERCVLASVAWKGQVARLTAPPEEGMEVVATGRLTTFGSQSKYQLNVEDVRPAGVGALMAMLEKRKKALEAEGLFAAERKRPLPFLPEVIGVVTSPSGAVIRDILHRLRERFPRKVLVWPVAVQGQTCAAEVARAIRGFNALAPGGPLPRPDLLIVARGGGSIEDLWGFNEEVVARAAADSAIPLISAVGHETDTTLIDYVSDRRAPTPTAAAEIAVPVRIELLAWAEQMGARGSRALAGGLDRRAVRLRDLSRALPRPDRLTEAARQRLDIAEERLPGALRAVIGRRSLALSEAAGSLRPGLLRRMIGEGRRASGQCGDRLGPALLRSVREHRRLFDRCAAQLRTERLPEALAARRRTVAELGRRLDRCALARLQERADRLRALDRLRETLGYRETLRRGYAVVRGDGAVVTAAAAARSARALEIEFSDGRVAAAPGRPQRGARTRQEPPEQGNLF